MRNQGIWGVNLSMPSGTTLGVRVDHSLVEEVTRERGNEGTRERGNEGTRERGNEGTRDRDNEITRERGNEGTREPGNQGTREPGNQGTREPGNEGTRERGNEGMRERGNEGTGERGNEVRNQGIWPGSKLTHAFRYYNRGQSWPPVSRRSRLYYWRGKLLCYRTGSWPLFGFGCTDFGLWC